MRSPSGWIAGLPPERVTRMGLCPARCWISAKTSSVVMGNQSDLCSGSTAYKLAHHEQRKSQPPVLTNTVGFPITGPSPCIVLNFSETLILLIITSHDLLDDLGRDA